MFLPGAHIAVAVSGGADSVALLRALHTLSAENQWTLQVLHVNHQLRGGESDQDAQFVRDLAAQLGLICKIAVLPIVEAGNLEQEARQVRAAWFELCVRENSENCTSLHKLHNVALGHTRSDQAETVLFRFLRGSGTSGLSGIRPILHNGFVRPLLDVTRNETRSYLYALQQPWREDSSNRDLSFDRNRIRLQLLPQLSSEWNPKIESVLAQTAEWAQAEEEFWQDRLTSLAATVFRTAPDRTVVAPVSAFTTVSTAESRRLIRHAISTVKGDLRAIDFGHIEQLRALILQLEGSGRLQIPGVDVMRSFDWVRFAIPGSYGGDRHLALPVTAPGTFPLFSTGSTLTLQVEDADYRYTDDVNRLDAESVVGPLLLRTWQPGDHYRPIGYSEQVKLKTLFQRARIPLWDRRLWPVLTMNDQVVWSRQFGAACDCAARPDSPRVVAVSEKSAVELNTVSPKLESGTGRPTSIS